MPQDKPTIFISYSHRDSEHLAAFRTVLDPALRDISDIQAWSDQKIGSAEHWDDEIRAALHKAEAAVLFISNHFLGSEYILTKELPILLQRERDPDFKLFVVYVCAVTKPALRVPLSPPKSKPTYDLGGVQAENSRSRSLKRLAEPEQTDLFVKLAEKLRDFADGRGAKAQRPPAGTPRSVRASPAQRQRFKAASDHAGSPRPECWIWLDNHGDKLRRSYLPPGHQQPLRPQISAPDAENTLGYWRPGYDFDGDQLFDLLFGQDQAEGLQLLANPWGEGGDHVPTRYPWRIRLVIDPREHKLQCLPWTTISHRGDRLADLGWTLELAPRAPAIIRPELAPHSFIMPGRILLLLPDSDRNPESIAHGRDLQMLLQQLWEKPAPIAIACTAEELQAQLQTFSPRLVYCFGRVSIVPGIRLNPTVAKTR